MEQPPESVKLRLGKLKGDPVLAGQVFDDLAGEEIYSFPAQSHVSYKMMLRSRTSLALIFLNIS